MDTFLPEGGEIFFELRDRKLERKLVWVDKKNGSGHAVTFLMQTKS